MKNLIKLLVLALVTLSSCDKNDDIHRLHYDYMPDQPIMLDVEIIPTEDVIIKFEETMEEINADYFNRYGIGINLILREREELSDAIKEDKEILTPRNDVYGVRNETIRVYVLPFEHINLISAAGYAVFNSNSIVIREERLVTGTLAHEIGHLLGLPHYEGDNNVMNLRGGSTQLGRPYDFTPEQVNIMINTIVNGYQTIDVNDLMDKSSVHYHE